MDHRTSRYEWQKEGGDVTLTCDVEGYPKLLISWVKDNVLLKSGSNSLTLANLKLNDSDTTYECWANNTHGFDARLYKLKVTS